jgi:hypothetical protein
MDDDLEFCFIRDSKDLPSPLPSSKQVREAPDNIQEIDVDAGRRVVIVGPYLVKYGKYASPLEGLNLLFLEQTLPDIPAPKLYAMWREGNEVFLVMEFFEGETLDKLWKTLGDRDKDTTVKMLRDIFKSLHSLPTSGFFGSITKGPIPYHLFWDPDKDPTVIRPFDTASDMIRGLAKRSGINSILNDAKPSLAEFFERNLAPALEDHYPVFCHSDVQRKNIIVQNISSATTGGADDLRLALVDWEVAGWYPSYWEYTMAFISFIWDENDDDWPERVEGFLPVKAAEASMFKLIHQNLWF